MALKILHRNHISFAQASGNSSVDNSFLTNKYRDEKWVTDSPVTSTVITGILGGPTLSPGTPRAIGGIALCHDLPLGTLIRSILYDGTVSPSNIVFDTEITKPIMPDLSQDGIFDATDLDANGHPNIGMGFNDHSYILALDSRPVATEFRIELTYPSAIIPVIKNVYVGDCFEAKFGINRSFLSYHVDTSEFIEVGKHLFSTDGRESKVFEFQWDRLTDVERMKIEIMARLVGKKKPVYIQGNVSSLAFGNAIDSMWGVFQEQPALARRAGMQADTFSAAGLAVEH